MAATVLAPSFGKHQRLCSVRTYSFNATQQMGTFVLGRCSGESNGLIFEDAPVLWWLMLGNDLVERIALHAGDKVHPGLRPFGKQPVVVVPPVIDHDGVRRKSHLVRGFDVMHLAVSDQTKARQIAVVVQHQVQLDCALGASKLGSVVHGQAQVNDGGVQAHELVFEAKFLLTQGLGRDNAEQTVEHLLKQLPRPMCIGVRQA